MSSASAFLLDVNVLIALTDPLHIHHEAAHRWWAADPARLWATCAVTENGLVRILTQPRYPNRLETAGEAISLLCRWKRVHATTHRWWPCDLSLSDEAVFEAGRILGAGSVTDVYLLGLAKGQGGRVVSFDRTLPWEAVVGGSPDLVELLGQQDATRGPVLPAFPSNRRNAPPGHPCRPSCSGTGWSWASPSGTRPAAPSSGSCRPGPRSA